MPLGQSKKQSSNHFTPLDISKIPASSLVGADGQPKQGRILSPPMPAVIRQPNRGTQLGIAPTSSAAPATPPAMPPPRSGTILGMSPPASIDSRRPIPRITSVRRTELFDVITSAPASIEAGIETLHPDELIPNEPDAQTIEFKKPTNIPSSESIQVNKPNQPPPPRRLHFAPIAQPAPPATPRNTRLRSESAEMELREVAHRSGLPPQGRSITPTPSPSQHPIEDDEFDDARTHHFPGALPMIVKPPPPPQGIPIPLTPPLMSADKNDPPTIALERNDSLGTPKLPSVPRIGGDAASSKPPPRIGGTTRPPQQSQASQGSQVKRPSIKNLDADIQTLHVEKQPDRILRLCWEFVRNKPVTFEKLRRVESELQKRLQMCFAHNEPAEVRCALYEAIGYVKGCIDFMVEMQTASVQPMIKEVEAPVAHVQVDAQKASPKTPLMSTLIEPISNISMWGMNVVAPLVTLIVFYKRSTFQASLIAALITLVAVFVTSFCWAHMGSAIRAPIAKIKFSIFLLIAGFAGALFFSETQPKREPPALMQGAQEKVNPTQSPKSSK